MDNPDHPPGYPPRPKRRYVSNVSDDTEETPSEVIVSLETDPKNEEIIALEGRWRVSDDIEATPLAAKASSAIESKPEGLCSSDDMEVKSLSTLAVPSTDLESDKTIASQERPEHIEAREAGEAAKAAAISDPASEPKSEKIKAHVLLTKGKRKIRRFFKLFSFRRPSSSEYKD
ncbi:MAG: hypothetical protein Q9167_007646 [Letrouitia subvulpina]